MKTSQSPYGSWVRSVHRFVNPLHKDANAC